MVAVRGALIRSALKAPEVERTTVFVMVGEGGASLRAVERVPREVLISARHMEVAKDALGVNPGQIWMLAGLAVIDLLGESSAFVLLTLL